MSGESRVERAGIFSSIQDFLISSTGRHGDNGCRGLRRGGNSAGLRSWHGAPFPYYAAKGDARVLPVCRASAWCPMLLGGLLIRSYGRFLDLSGTDWCYRCMTGALSSLGIIMKQCQEYETVDSWRSNPWQSVGNEPVAIPLRQEAPSPSTMGLQVRLMELRSLVSVIATTQRWLAPLPVQLDMSGTLLIRQLHLARTPVPPHHQCLCLPFQISFSLHFHGRYEVHGLLQCRREHESLCPNFNRNSSISTGTSS